MSMKKFFLLVVVVFVFLGTAWLLTAAWFADGSKLTGELCSKATYVLLRLVVPLLFFWYSIWEIPSALVVGHNGGRAWVSATRSLLYGWILLAVASLLLAALIYVTPPLVGALLFLGCAALLLSVPFERVPQVAKFYFGHFYWDAKRIGVFTAYRNITVDAASKLDMGDRFVYGAYVLTTAVVAFICPWLHIAWVLISTAVLSVSSIILLAIFFYQIGRKGYTPLAHLLG